MSVESAIEKRPVAIKRKFRHIEKINKIDIVFSVYLNYY
jgi:hypothetical protein